MDDRPPPLRPDPGDGGPVPSPRTHLPHAAPQHDLPEHAMSTFRPASAAAPAAPPADVPDLVVLSHLRWPWVWQRPQHLVSRLARVRAEQGARTWFVEEPVVDDVDTPALRFEELDGLTRVQLVVPHAAPTRGERPGPGHGFENPAAAGYGDLLARALERMGRPARPDVWVYTPMAIELAQRLEAGCLVYDVMDDLASFRDAPQGLLLRQRRLLAEADVVFTGGPSLHRGVLRQRQEGVHLFRSGVETGHYAASRVLRTPHDRPVAGYVGVLDERLDLVLVAELARRLPDWTVRLVGPVTKIDPADLPQGPNLEYPGMATYDRLPEVMAGFDVALMPFALNEATRSISPTKTLEYLAAGLPVVSTGVPDVVADYADVVHLADDGAGFAAACRRAVADDAVQRDRRVRQLQARQEWDHIAASMEDLLESARAADRAASSSSEETA